MRFHLSTHWLATPISDWSAVWIKNTMWADNRIVHVIRGHNKPSRIVGGLRVEWPQCLRKESVLPQWKVVPTVAFFSLWYFSVWIKRQNISRLFLALPVGLRISWFYPLQRDKTPPQMGYPGYDSKQHSILRLQFWMNVWYTLSLPLLPGPLGRVIIVLVRLASMG